MPDPKSPEQSATGLLETSLRMYPGRTYRVGMRSALADAASACEAVRAEIESGRKSECRERISAALTRCVSLLDAMRNAVEVPNE